MKTIIYVIKNNISKLRWKIVMFIGFLGVILILTSIWFIGSMEREYPSVNIDQQLMHERLFISVRQDSLSQLVNAKGLNYSGPGIFRRRASMGIPSDQMLMNELDSLQHYYPDEIEIEDGQLLCHTQKVEGVRYVSVPVIWLIKLRLMNTPAIKESEDE